MLILVNNQDTVIKKTGKVAVLTECTVSET